MERSYAVVKRAREGEAAESPCKRARSQYEPGTPESVETPAPPPALAPPRKQLLFANAVQLPRLVKARRRALRGSPPGRHIARRACLSPPARALPPR